MTAFLSNLADRGASASTQNQALSALLFLYDAGLGMRLPALDAVVPAQRPVRLPVVLSRDEVAALLSHLLGAVWLMASLMYRAGLRLTECAELRVKEAPERGGRVGPKATEREARGFRVGDGHDPEGTSSKNRVDEAANISSTVWMSAVPNADLSSCEGYR